VIESLRLLIRKVIYALRGGFLVRPLLISVVLGLAGMMLSPIRAACGSPFPPALWSLASR
jgi:hypothetical protein